MPSRSITRPPTPISWRSTTPTSIEQKLYLMFLEHRMRTFQGSFHANPDYALWYGWSKMVSDITEIRKMAADLRKEKKAKR